MNLFEVVSYYNVPIDEEQAWAICYLCGKYLQPKGVYEMPLPAGPQSINFDQEGNVTVDGNLTDNQAKVVNHLGQAVLAALDYGLAVDEQHLLAEDLYNLISRMTGNVTSSDDDAEEGCADKSQETTVDDIIEMCEQHLTASTDADSYYRDVCKQLYKDAIEMKRLMCQIASANEYLESISVDPNQQNRTESASLYTIEWANLWMPVLHELREGRIKLRKVDPQTKQVSDYKLTPYEVLMEEIRKGRFSLKKVPVSAEGKKNTHDLILDFIKSRPNLSPAHERVLAPTPPRSKSLHEQLIEQIQEQSLALKHVEVTSSKSNCVKDPLSRGAAAGMTSSGKRRRIKPSVTDDALADTDDSSQNESDVEEIEVYMSDDDVTDDLTSFYVSDEVNASSLRSPGTSGRSSSAADNVIGNGDRRMNLQMTKSPSRKRVLPLELLPSPTTPASPMLRKPSFFGSLFSSFRQPSGMRRSQSAFNSLQKSSDHILVTGSRWKQETLNEDSFVSTPLKRTFSERRSHTMMFPKNFSSCPCVSLTLEEIIHIRRVLTRAQLEKYQFSQQLYQALKNEKICFNCRNRIFNLFIWPHTCHICDQKVCSRCIKKVRRPTSKYIETPLLSLSPLLSPIMMKQRNDRMVAPPPTRLTAVDCHPEDTPNYMLHS